MRFPFLLNSLKDLNLETTLLVSAGVNGLVFWLLPTSLELEARLLAAWSAGIICFLAVTALMMSHANSEQIRRRVRHRKTIPNFVFTLLVVLTSLASIFVIGFMLANGKNRTELLLSEVAILCSWLLTHTTFALHYAQAYYNVEDLSQAENYAKGLEFPGNEPPNYWDFMYFAITISMTAATSDVSITSQRLRRLVLAHELVSFFFYAVILGLAINEIGYLF